MQRPLVVGDENDAPLLRQHHDGLPQRAARMQSREILAAKSLLLQERDGQRITECECRRRTRCRREIVRARFLAYPGIERDVAEPRKRGAHLPDDADCAYPEPLEMFEQSEHLI